MADSFNSFTAATAWVASLGVHAPHHDAPPVQHEVARDVLRHAQVALYCDHDQDAIHALREARRLLAEADARGQLARRSVDEAAWHIRHHHAGEALTALEAARDRLA